MTRKTGIQVRPIIGLEIHVQLRTRTKLWCGCPVEFAAPPNARTCPVCLGLPGALPVLNEKAVELATLAGLALNCAIAPVTRWDRKGYYYPDQPKNYQISQYQLPLCAGGYFELKHDHRISKIRIQRAHLEDDAGKIIHDLPQGAGVDLNRAGAPLLEIVTQPDMRCPDEAHEFATQLQRLMRYLGVSEANMQKGQMRFEPNINVEIREDGRTFRTPIVEVKNLNSFRALRGAIQHEVERQVEEFHQNRRTAAEGNKTNRGWDDARGVTVAQRQKEEAHDYRYFPDPDVAPLVTDRAWIEQQRLHLPELPIPRTERFISEYKVPEQDAPMLVDCRATADLLDQAAEAGGDKRTLGKHFLGFWAHLARERHTTIAGLGLPAPRFAELANLVAEAVINATAAAQIATEMAHTVDRLFAEVARPAPEICANQFPARDAPDLAPRCIAERLGLLQCSDADEIMIWLTQALAANPDAVRDAIGDAKKAGAARGYLAGQVMQLSHGQANPQIVNRLLEERLRALPQKP